MAKESIQSLTIENLRGSVSPFKLTFEKGKKLSVIYGENGTGKSTICDALDLLGKGNVGSLNNRGLGKTNQYWYSIGRTPKDVCVKLETSGGSCKATLTKSGVSVDPEAKRPQVEVLRRSQILGLVEATAAERYEAIKKFIDVSGIEESEASLRQLIRDIESKFDVAVARVDENTRTINHFWEQAEKPGVSAKEWATQEIGKDQSVLDAAKTAIDSLKLAYVKLASYPDQYQKQLDAYNAADEAVKSAQNSVTALSEQVTDEYFGVLEILRAAQQHFSRHPHPDVCPLCESSENILGLMDRVNHQLASHNIANQLKSAQATLSSKQQLFARQQDQLQELKEKALAEAKKLEQSANNEHLPKDINLPVLPCPTDLSEWKNWLVLAPQLLDEWGKAADAYIENKKFTGTLEASMHALETNSQIKQDLEQVLPRLKEALTAVADERKKFTDSILQRISEDVGRLYEAVHPTEGLNKISLELDPRKRASLEIATEFHGQDGIPPQAYFSDSHLDTLGLCVFIALAQMEKPAETILVLDDVLASVDEPHVERLIEMLYSEALKFRQCIITTHYKPWKQKLRWGWLNSGQCQFIELTKWTPTEGISSTRSIPDVERLRLLLQETPPDPQLVCAKAGVILEATLDFLTILYECHVPRRANSAYTLGELLPAVDKRLRAALRVEHKHNSEDGTILYVDKQLAPHLDELTKIAQARNVFGCHFNQLSFDLLDTDAIRFGSEVLALIDCLIDHEAGWPRNSKSGSYWATSGETRRLHPLKKPS